MSVTEQDVHVATPASAPEDVIKWVAEIVELTTPDAIEFSDGSQEGWDRLTSQMVRSGMFTKLNEEKRPNSFLTCSRPSDVARVESRTFICCEEEEDAGPTSHWADPKETRTILREEFTDSMRGHTTYVMPFSIGPLSGPISQLGIEITDSPYVAVNMRIITHMGTAAMDLINEGHVWVPVVHSVGAPLEPGQEDSTWPCSDEKYIAHFPKTNEIWPFGSGHGGNALLDRRYFTLRIASTMAKHNDWMTKHMLVLRLTRGSTDQQFHVTTAFLSACGRTNLAMFQPTIPGYKVETAGDDIAQVRPGQDGRLRVTNPEAGFFGVAPGTSYKTSPVTMETDKTNSIFTNIALTDDGDVWWGDIGGKVPAHLIDWHGNDQTPESGEKAVHPNSRFTIPASQCPIICLDWETPESVTVDTILFDGHHATSVPLVAEQYELVHGVFIDTSVTFEITTAAIDAKAGSLRHDPFTMLPFYGYNMADYWSHWLEMQDKLDNKFPKVYQVNWFRKNEGGNFIWPGYGDNARVLDRIVRRAAGEVEAIGGMTGRYPRSEGSNLDGLDIDEAVWAKLFAIDPDAWAVEMDDAKEYFSQFDSKLSVAITEQLARFRERITAAKARAAA